MRGHYVLTFWFAENLMNILGSDVATALRKSCKLPNSCLVVVHDSLSHKPRTLSYKAGGSANGHNGVRSIISALGNQQDFHRLRIGIGRDGTDTAEYVLSPLSAEERLFWNHSGPGTDLVWKQLEVITRQQGDCKGSQG
jgi:peptidyl-tRNA hydrolase, PTH1 family